MCYSDKMWFCSQQVQQISQAYQENVNQAQSAHGFEPVWEMLSIKYNVCDHFVHGVTFPTENQSLMFLYFDQCYGSILSSPV